MTTRYTTRQVSDQTGIPQVTLRRYAKDYKKFMSRDSQKGRIKYFTDKDVAILAFIRKAYETQMTADQIYDRLETGNFEIKEGSALALLPEIREGFQLMNQRQEATEDRQDRTESALQRQEQELARLRRQNRLALALVALAIAGTIILYFLTAS